MVVGGRVTFLIGGRKFRAEPSLVFHSYRKPVKLGTQNPVKVDSVSIQSGTVSASVFFFHPTISLQKKNKQKKTKNALVRFSSSISLHRGRFLPSSFTGFLRVEGMLFVFFFVLVMDLLSLYQVSINSTRLIRISMGKSNKVSYFF